MGDLEKESQNFFLLVKLIVDVGTSVLRDVLLNVLAPDTLDNILQTNINKINSLRFGRAKVLFDREFSLLTETPPDLEKFDITLLVKIFRNICPSICSNFVPFSPYDTGLANDILQLRDIRNSILAHKASTRVTNAEFQTLWSDVRTVISRIDNHGSTGLKQKVEDTIDNMLTENINQSRPDDLPRNWHQENTKELDDIQNELKQQVCFFLIYTQNKEEGKGQ